MTMHSHAYFIIFLHQATILWFHASPLAEEFSLDFAIDFALKLHEREYCSSRITVDKKIGI